ncbi:MAG: hypothetical protein NHB15_12215 [Methanosarcina barkeri]|nr:hypothetical protein [Methanosarcina sp. ERenArc_MAG2]
MKAVELIARKKVNVLVVRTVGEGPFHMLRDNFIKILRTPEGADTAGDILDRVQDLEEITTPAE